MGKLHDQSRSIVMIVSNYYDQSGCIVIVMGKFNDQLRCIVIVLSQCHIYLVVVYCDGWDCAGYKPRS